MTEEVADVQKRKARRTIVILIAVVAAVYVGFFFTQASR